MARFTEQRHENAAVTQQQIEQSEITPQLLPFKLNSTRLDQLCVRKQSTGSCNSVTNRNIKQEGKNKRQVFELLKEADI